VSPQSLQEEAEEEAEVEEEEEEAEAVAAEGYLQERHLQAELHPFMENWEEIPQPNSTETGRKVALFSSHSYREMNPTVEQLAIPYQRAMTFLSYIRGPLVDDWVDEQAQWLMEQVQTGVAHAEENLWRTIEDRFQQAYTNTAKKANAQHQLRDFRMKGDDIDTYISTFQNLA